jgi:hypothetical protein
MLVFTPAMVSNSLSMARDEMEIIKALQTEVIREHLDKLLFYYGVDDNWSPITHYKEMVALFPEGKYILNHIHLLFSYSFHFCLIFRTNLFV